MAELLCVDLGRESYERALELQMRLVERVRVADNDLGYLLLVEHDPPVITLGSRGNREHLLASPDQLAREGITVHETRRGGDVTYHGPGQLVAYPIVRLDRGRGVRQYQRDLEGAVLRVLDELGLHGRRIDGLTGVWVGEKKVAAIGVAVRRWVSYHGLSLNVSPDMAHFDTIIPCGLHGRNVTSLQRLLERDIVVDEVKEPLASALAATLGFGTIGWIKPDEITGPSRLPGRKPLPPWLKKRIPSGGEAAKVHALLADLHLATVCSGARCPNLAECYARGTATFLILGETCTRSCRFCAVPTSPPQPPRQDGPQAVAQAAERMGLRHVVITSVTRDDLPDGGAEHFARTIQAVRDRLPDAVVEVLTPDFQGSRSSVEAVLTAGPDIFNHNVETVPRLYSQIRPQADYKQSLGVLAAAKEVASDLKIKIYTKSGLMVGLGETDEELEQVMRNLRAVGCDILTLGQYLAPSSAHAQVQRFVEPERFAAWKAQAEAMGYAAVAAGPFVRSSYHADQVFDNALRSKN